MKSNRFAMVLSLGLAVAILGGAAHAASPEQSNAAQAFDKLKTLVGKWEGTSPTGTVTTTFELTGGGTALVERIKNGKEPEMTTVYHLDGDRLVLTHYCSAGNQPHLEAESLDPASNELHFRFVNASNLANANAGHMHNAAIKLVSPDQFTADWGWQENGKIAMHVVVENHRVR